ncbi:MAG: endonuclease/exonuclease/phosphatase family protein [Planctomycetota bacterium]
MVALLLSTAVVPCWLGLGARWHWTLDLCAHPQLLYLLALAPGALLLLTLGHRRAALVCAATAGLAALRLAPLWLPAPMTVDTGTRTEALRILAANLCFENPHPERLLPYARAQDAAVLGLSEITARQEQQLAALRREWPHALVATNDDCYGMALFSRLPLRAAEVIELGPPRARAIRAVVDTAAGPVGLLLIHPPRPGSAERGAERDAALLTIEGAIAALPPLRVVFGDANATRWSEPFAGVVARCGLRDSSDGHGHQGSWPVALPALLRLPIDHVLCSDGIAVRQRELGPDFGSDHLPVFAELLLPLDRAR